MNLDRILGREKKRTKINIVVYNCFCITIANTVHIASYSLSYLTITLAHFIISRIMIIEKGSRLCNNIVIKIAFYCLALRLSYLVISSLPQVIHILSPKQWHCDEIGTSVSYRVKKVTAIKNPTFLRWYGQWCKVLE